MNHVKRLVQQSAGEVADGIPDSEEADDEDRKEDEENVFRMDADRVGVDNEGAAAGAELHDAVGLLNPAEQEADGNADESTDGRDKATLEEENAGDDLVGGAEVAQGDDVILLVDDEHGERADDVEAGHDEDKGEEDVGNELLNLHDLEGLVLLLKAVLDVEIVTGNLLHLGLDGIEIAARL